MLLTCSYKNKEFVRVGYYVNSEYTEPELIEAPPEVPHIEKLQRNIMTDYPRVTKFAHDFDNDPVMPDPEDMQEEEEGEGEGEEQENLEPQGNMPEAAAGAQGEREREGGMDLDKPMAMSQ